MVSKKHPFHDLEKKRNSLLAIGLCLSLFVVLTAMEWTSSTMTIKELPQLVIADIEDVDIIITQPAVKKPKPPEQPPQPRPDPEPEPEPSPEPEPEPEPRMDSIVIPDEPEPAEPDIPFKVVEKMPQFGKGLEDLMNYLGANIKYPQMAKDAGVEGTVYVEFVVNKKGEIENSTVVKGIGYGCDKESLRVVTGMPKWKPGKQRGKRVSVQFTLPVKYILQ